MSDTHDLWPDDISNSLVEVPATIVKEAARPLAQKTGGLVEAEVKTGADGPFLLHRIYLVAPSIGWRMRFAAFRHRPLPLFPVWAEYEVESGDPYREGKPIDPFAGIREAVGHRPLDNPPGDELASPEELREWLGIALSSDETTMLLRGIVSTLRTTVSIS